MKVIGIKSYNCTILYIHNLLKFVLVTQHFILTAVNMHHCITLSENSPMKARVKSQESGFYFTFNNVLSRLVLYKT